MWHFLKLKQSELSIVSLSRFSSAVARCSKWENGPITLQIFSEWNNIYRPQRSWGKVMFLHVSVILFTGGWGGGGMPACIAGGISACLAAGLLGGGGGIPACFEGGIPACLAGLWGVSPGPHWGGSPDPHLGGLCIPACTEADPPMVYLPGCVPAWGVYLPRGCTCLSACWDTHTPGQTPPGQTHTPGRHTFPWADPPPSPRSLQRTVRILLECIFVLHAIVNQSTDSWLMMSN